MVTILCLKKYKMINENFSNLQHNTCTKSGRTASILLCFDAVTWTLDEWNLQFLSEWLPFKFQKHSMKCFQWYLLQRDY